MEARRRRIESDPPPWFMTRPRERLGLPRASCYHRPKPVAEENLRRTRLTDAGNQ